MLINHIWASIIEIWFQKWHTQSLKKIEIQMSRHEKRYRSEEMSPGRVRFLFVGTSIRKLCPRKRKTLKFKMIKIIKKK